MKTIKHSATLFYYDGIQIFEAHDIIGGHYIALLVQQRDENDQFLVCGVSPEQLQRFRVGEIDLRTLIVERADGEWYLADVHGFEDAILLSVSSSEEIPSEFLPEEGFVLRGMIEDRKELSLIEARSRNNVVLDLSLDPPESATGHRIHATTLSGILAHIQTLVKHAYARAIKDMSKEARKSMEKFEKIDAHLLDVVVPAATGSFRLVLEATKPPDLFGFSEIVRALQKIDEITEVANDPKETIERLRKNQGHFAGAYMRLLNFIVKTDSGIRYSWAKPDDIHCTFRSVRQVEARPLFDELNKAENLSTESVTLVGPLRKADVDAGAWRIVDADSGDTSGKVKEGGPSLSHLETDKVYRFSCEEVIEEITGTGKEVRTLYLVDYNPA